MTGVVLLLIIVLPVAGAVAAGLLPAHARSVAGWLAGAVAVVGFGLTWAMRDAVVADAVRYDVEWMPSLGLNFVLRMDGFAWLFSAMVTGIGALVVLYARYYMSAQDPVPRFY